MKKLQYIIALVLLSGSLFAQQDAMYSQYMFNMLAVNPAYAGNREVLSITGLTRAQWVGLKGAPVSNTVSIDAPIRNKHIGLGAQLFNEKIGVTSSTGFYGSYAYRIRLKKSTLAFGLQGGMVHYTANYTQVILDRTTVNTDKSFKENASVLMPALGAGVFFSDDDYYIGLSVPGLFSTHITFGNEIEVNKDNHLFAMAGYVFPLNKDFKLKPSVLLKAVTGAPLELDANINLWMYDRLALGLSYRTGDAAVGMVEVQVAPNFRVGYAYDYGLTDLSYFHSGSHELILRYEFGYTKDKILTPRYF
ncbi:MAG: type IX secretion system membrane protein PorP/SprF [Bacteroidota bacterium]